jgi:hypothetical protein
MTVADKGHVLYLLDLDKSYEEVSEITGYSPERVWILWDTFGNDKFKRVLKEAFYERRNNEQLDEVQSTIEQNQHKPINRSRSARTKKVSSTTFQKGVRDIGTGRHYVPRERTRRDNSKGDVRSGSIVDRMRKHKDYRGD